MRKYLFLILFFLPTLVFADPNVNVTSYYPMQGNSTDVISARSGSDTSVSYSTSYGIVAQGASFNGSNSSINIAGTSLTDFTLDFWFKTSASVSGSDLDMFSISNGSNNANLDCVLQYNTAYIKCNTYNGSSAPSITGSVALNNGVWHMVTFTRSGTAEVLYVDDSSVGSVTDTGVTLGSNWALGYNRPNSNSYYSGYLDEVGVWTSALTAPDIACLYNSGAGNTYSFSCGATTSTSTLTFGTLSDIEYLLGAILFVLCFFFWKSVCEMLMPSYFKFHDNAY